MSQRELAVAVGVAPSTVAAIESGARHPSVELLDRLLRASGLRLAVVDADGVELAPFPDEAVRDNAGRRFPAHLDVLPPDRVPPTRVASPRYDRPPAKGWYRLRADAPREGAVGPRADHPTVAEVELARQKTLYGRSPTWPRREATLREAWGLAPGPDDD